MSRLSLINGQVISLDHADREYEAVSINNGKIEAVDTNDEVLSMKDSNTEVIDLKGKTVLPGFIDAHQHMISTGFNLLNVDCRLGSINEIVEALKAKAATVPADQWIIGWGLDEAKITEKRLPNIRDLAEIPNPVYITRFCLHTACVNEKALNKAEINSSTAEPAGGEILRFENGEPNGILREKAMDLVKNIMPPKSLHETKEAILTADKEYLSQGLTSVHEAGIGFYTGSFDEFRAFTELSVDDKLNVSVYGMILDEYFPEIKNLGFPFGFGNSKFKLAGLKLFSDGALSGQTAAVRDDYVYPAGTSGMLMMKDEEMFDKMKLAHDNGYQIAIHAIGDRAVEQVIRVYKKVIESNPSIQMRHRIEHAGLTDHQLLKEMKSLNLIPVPHPGIVKNAGDVYKKVLKEDVFKGLYAVRDFIDYDLTPAGSSDAPVTPFNPLWGIYSAMSRHSETNEVLLPEQRISLKEAVKMFTINAAYAAYEEKEKGTIELGKAGDLVILPKEFMNFTFDQVKDCKVGMTIKEGEIVYSNSDTM